MKFINEDAFFTDKKEVWEEDILFEGGCKISFIEKEEIHRIENPTETDAMIIEIQVGDYLGEDDIVRLEDIYGR